MISRNNNFVNSKKEEICIQNLREVKEVFDKFGIKFWLDWGTLLGAVRDKKLIPWDSDIDLGIMCDEQEKIISAASEFKKKGILVNEIPIPIAAGDLQYKRLTLCRFGQGIDIMPYWTKGENAMAIIFDPEDAVGSWLSRTFTYFLWLLWCSSVSSQLNPESRYKLIIVRFIQYCFFLLPNKLKKCLVKITKKALLKREFVRQSIIVQKTYFETFDKIKFYGMTFDIPSNAENYLEFKYGKEWRTPDKNWHYRNDGAAKHF